MDAKNNPENLRGKRYIAYARCAAQQESTTKLRRQIRFIRQFGDRLGMQCVDEVRVVGASGRTPVLRPDLRQLLIRKRKKNDFDVLIVQDYSRLTRAYLTGAARIEALFALDGVQIVYLTDAWVWHSDGTAVHHRMAQG